MSDPNPGAVDLAPIQAIDLVCAGGTAVSGHHTSSGISMTSAEILAP